MAHTQDYPEAFPLDDEDERFGVAWYRECMKLVEQRRKYREQHGDHYDLGLPCINNAIYEANKIVPRTYDYTPVEFYEWDRVNGSISIPPEVRAA